MILKIDEKSRKILGKDELVIIIEHVDDVALLVGQMLKMCLHTILDKHIPKHWKQRNLSWGLTSVIWLAYILTSGDHRKVSVEQYIKGMEKTLSNLVGQKIDPLDFSDDRLAHLLRHLSNARRWEKIEHDLNEHSIEIYELPQDVLRCDTTTVSGYHDVTKEGIFQFGFSKGDPNLPQIKVMVCSLDPLGMPLAIDVVSGEKSDDKMYIPVIDRALGCFEKTGLLFVGDSKMSALATRTHIVVSANHYLVPLPLTGATAKEMDQWIAQGVIKDKNGELDLVFKKNDDGTDIFLAKGYEIERCCSQNEGNVEWKERVLIINSPAHAQQQAENLEKRLTNAEEKIAALTPTRGRGKRQIVSEANLLDAINEIIKEQRVEDLLVFEYEKQTDIKIQYIGAGRGSVDRVKIEVEKIRYQILKIERSDKKITSLKETFGWKAFATSTNIEQLSLKDAVLCYRNQYRIERIFRRLKSRLNISPLFVKQEDQITGMTNLLTLGARVLILIEFIIQMSLQKDNKQLRDMYPENPDKTTAKPTSERILKAFSMISLTVIRNLDGDEIMRYLTPLSNVQKEIIIRLKLDVSIYRNIEINDVYT